MVNVVHLLPTHNSMVHQNAKCKAPVVAIKQRLVLTEHRQQCTSSIFPHARLSYRPPLFRPEVRLVPPPLPEPLPCSDCFANGGLPASSTHPPPKIVPETNSGQPNTALLHPKKKKKKSHGSAQSRIWSEFWQFVHPACTHAPL